MSSHAAKIRQNTGRGLQCMRQVILLWVLLLSCGLAMSQGEWVPPGTYAQPFVSRISTPSAAPESILPPFLSLDSPSLTVGATNAGAGNVAGAGR